MFSLRDQKVNVVFLARVNRIVDSNVLSFLVGRKNASQFFKTVEESDRLCWVSSSFYSRRVKFFEALFLT